MILVYMDDYCQHTIPCGQNFSALVVSPWRSQHPPPTTSCPVGITMDNQTKVMDQALKSFTCYMFKYLKPSSQLNHARTWH